MFKNSNLKKVLIIMLCVLMLAGQASAWGWFTKPIPPQVFNNNTNLSLGNLLIQNDLMVNNQICLNGECLFNWTNLSVNLNLSSYLKIDGSNANTNINVSPYNLYVNNLTGNEGYFENIYTIELINNLYFNKSISNSTGLIGLECSNGEILEFDSATGLWECAIDSTGTTPNLQQVLTQGNTATSNIITTGNVSANTFTMSSNHSYGMWSNETHFVIGYIGGLP